MLDIRKNLSAYINDSGIKQTHIAHKTGLSEAKVGAILNLKRKMDANEFISICDALGVSPATISRYRETG